MPPVAPCWPLNAIIQMVRSAWAATSGMLRKLGEPWLADALTPSCQTGSGKVVLEPPPLPDHAVSPDQTPAGPLVLKVVPPTTVMLGSSEGG